eukprot:scaffold8498_cov105-Isochrysis_galbana.AAC.2
MFALMFVVCKDADIFTYVPQLGGVYVSTSKRLAIRSVMERVPAASMWKSLSRQSGMVQPAVNEMFATVHAAGSSLLGLFTSCTTFDSTRVFKMNHPRARCHLAIAIAA